jgi:AcrR family transcriptional regulator
MRVEGGRTDRRVQRTIRALREALLDLIIEKSYEDVTIQDIIDRANVGRSTFYSHFYDKEQLLLGCIGWLRQSLTEQRAASPETDGSAGFRFGFSLAMLKHVQANERLYRATVGRDSGTLVLHHVQRMIAELAEEEMARLNQSWMLPRQVLLAYIVHTYMALLQWWIEHDSARSAEEIDEQFHRLAFKGLDGLL